ncbi:hypothetical protein [Vreelandella alkaliphila]|uniref:Uncharacterized protein n=1 Tax=Vreelandella alkaliphila TaxID=272774 RepID=A0A7C9JRP0_9GAMM|nr:hypothetical protein [Halomonas alkaliphila]NDL70040.1 hypothetical protein [Halomonas alkaliphila]
MSAQDQAAGLRKWADLQRQQRQATPEGNALTDDTVAQVMPAAVEEHSTVVPQRPLMVIGLPNSGEQQIAKVKGRLAQWSVLGRRWAGDPDDWDIHIVNVNADNLAQLKHRYSRWALWINSDAEAFGPMYRALRHLRENGGPQQLLALHEPHLPRRGLLENLQEAAARYLEIELLLLAR